MALLIANSKELFEQTDLKTIYHILSDSFFVPGIVITGFGLLIFASNEGVFDGVTYAVMSFINMFKSKEERKYSSLYDYKQKKHAVKTKTGFILISGLIILTFGIVFYILYSRV